MSSPQHVTVDQVRQILSEVIDSLESPDYSSKLDEAKEAAGNEMLKMMQIVFPMVVQIEMETIKRHGFSNSREGMYYYISGRVIYAVSSTGLLQRNTALFWIEGIVSVNTDYSLLVESMWRFSQTVLELNHVNFN